MNEPPSIEAKEKIHVLGMHMTPEQYLHFEGLLENLLASVNLLAERYRAHARSDRVRRSKNKRDWHRWAILWHRSGSTSRGSDLPDLRSHRHVAVSGTTRRMSQ
jgi:hypothetical protein